MRVTSISELVRGDGGPARPARGRPTASSACCTASSRPLIFDLEDKRKKNLGPTVKWLEKLDGTTPFTWPTWCKRPWAAIQFPSTPAPWPRCASSTWSATRTSQRGVCRGWSGRLPRPRGWSSARCCTSWAPTSPPIPFRPRARYPLADRARPPRAVSPSGGAARDEAGRWRQRPSPPSKQGRQIGGRRRAGREQARRRRAADERRPGRRAGKPRSAGKTREPASRGGQERPLRREAARPRRRPACRRSCKKRKAAEGSRNASHADATGLPSPARSQRASALPDLRVRSLQRIPFTVLSPGRPSRWLDSWPDAIAGAW